VYKETGRWKSRWKIRDLLADGRCSQAVQDFLSATEVKRRVPAEEDAGSEASEWERREREEERLVEAEGLGAAGEVVRDTCKVRLTMPSRLRLLCRCMR